ncbi:hypothetical protein N7489_004672 [Penicillium chrysogenum]|uniref:Uncharacterized protein n=2 Tax=Penicillium chrysogenum species complex TaxID=254878 RepID=B6HWU7_PENRW|nr:uncharacterized protein N7489_004672 [Penicillium chrysogenum]KAJ5853036.1 hypothetical protein N7534_005579 [Penicillium rubens]CAG8126944.1 unnamed protein product [Penicillium nalgiovense]CAP87065.1 hypothetical protein PCH_Pc24g01570 [Penicillium rubens Wisconsin 54-1255]KAJ5244576.1 hypothetical protein N7489_004672 [Penicillium chrysogenum]KZN87797.1 hypothetical protein EN45_063580 [Penicillium chrysogenum]
MPPTTINQNALSRLTELSAWVSETNEFKAEQENLFRCSDEGRHVRVDPLLGELGFNKIKGYGYSIWRITGKIALKATRHYQSLFFPLSIKSGSGSAAGEVQAAGEVLTPGSYISFSSPLTLDSQLDCLIVYLPKTDDSSVAE